MSPTPEVAVSRRPDQRALRESPYLIEHARSQRDRRAEPRGFAGLLRWFLEGFWAETPERVHTVGVWFGRPPRLDASGRPVEDVAAELVGGSQLGAPKQAEPFRQLLENSPRQIAGDGAEEHYVRPMRAALARLAGRRDGSAALMARYLLQVAYAQGDWESVATRWFPIHEDEVACRCWLARRPFTHDALRRLYGAYSAEPPVRYLPGPSWVDVSESQRHAIEAGERGAA